MADEKPKGGRPKSLEPGAHVSAWIPLRDHERLSKLAQQSDQSLSKVIKKLLTRPTPPV